MTDAIGGFSQGLARATEGLANQVQASREMEERKSQFEDQKRISLATQGFMADAQGNIVVNPDSPVTKAREAEVQRTLAEANRIGAETPTGREIGAREQTALAGAQSAETGAKAGKLDLAGKEGADFYGKAPGIQLRGMGAQVEGQEWANAASRFEVANQERRWLFTEQQARANIEATKAGTVATKEQAKTSATQRREMVRNNERQDRQDALQQFATIAGVMDQALRTKLLADEGRLKNVQMVTSIAMSGQDAITATEQFLLKQWTDLRPGSTPSAEDAAQIRQTAALFAPDVATAFDLAAGIMDQEPESAEIIAQDLEKVMAMVAQAGDLPPERMGKIKELIKAQSLLMGLKAEVYSTPEQGPSSQPTTPGSKAPGISKSKPSPISLIRDRMVNPSPAPVESPLKFPVLPQDDIKRASREVVDRSIRDAYGNITDPKRRVALESVAGVPTLADAIKILNKKSAGNWAKGPNNEIVALPRAEEVDTTGWKVPGFPDETHEFNRQIKQKIPAVLQRLSEGNAYATTFSKLVLDGKVDANASPYDPATMLKVIREFGYFTEE